MALSTNIFAIRFSTRIIFSSAAARNPTTNEANLAPRWAAPSAATTLSSSLALKDFAIGSKSSRSERFLKPAWLNGDLSSILPAHQLKNPFSPAGQYRLITTWRRFRSGQPKPPLSAAPWPRTIPSRTNKQHASGNVPVSNYNFNGARSETLTSGRSESIRPSPRKTRCMRSTTFIRTLR